MFCFLHPFRRWDNLCFTLTLQQIGALLITENGWKSRWRTENGFCCVNSTWFLFWTEKVIGAFSRFPTGKSSSKFLSVNQVTHVNVQKSTKTVGLNTPFQPTFFAKGSEHRRKVQWKQPTVGWLFWLPYLPTRDADRKKIMICFDFVSVVSTPMCTKTEGYCPQGVVPLPDVSGMILFWRFLLDRLEARLMFQHTDIFTGVKSWGCWAFQAVKRHLRKKHLKK